MSNRPRPSLKGRGSEIFFSEDDEADETEASGAESIGDGEASQTAVMPGNERGDSHYSGEMKKLTFNLPLELSFALDEIQLNLRRATRSGVTKTEIVQAALERTLREFQEEGVDSQLLTDLGLDVTHSRD
jgi:hypothetical protein